MEQTAELSTDTIPCVECFHFKTVLVTTYNIKHFFFQDSNLVQKKLFDLGKVRVWYCKKGNLANAVYVTKYHAYMLTNLTCPCRDV